MSMGWREEKQSHVIVSDMKKNLRTELFLEKPLFFTVRGLLGSLVIASSTEATERTEKGAERSFGSEERQEVSSPGVFYNYCHQ